MEIIKIYKLGYELNQLRIGIMTLERFFPNAVFKLLEKEDNEKYIDRVKDSIKTTFDAHIRMLDNIQINLNQISDYLETLSISPSSLKEILHAKEHLIKYQELLNSIGDEYVQYGKGLKAWKGMLQDISEYLSNRLFLWTDRIESDIMEIKVIQFKNQTSLNPHYLSKGAKTFFSDKTWSKLSEIEKKDLNDGCKCILLGLWTPASIIIMRAVESAVRKYYHDNTGKDPVKKGWKKLVKELENFSPSDKTFIKYFDYLRSIRNPLVHPESCYTQFEAEQVFSHAIHIFTKLNSI